MASSRQMGLDKIVPSAMWTNTMTQWLIVKMVIDEIDEDFFVVN
jgi:hypothetical protein